MRRFEYRLCASDIPEDISLLAKLLEFFQHEA